MKIKDTIIILAIVTFMSLFSNVLGTKADIMQSIPGLLILAVIAFVGMLCAKYLPGNIPAAAWVVTLGCIVTIPGVPGSDIINGYVKHVGFVALCTPILAYAGVSIGKDRLAYCCAVDCRIRWHLYWQCDYCAGYFEVFGTDLIRSIAAKAPSTSSAFLDVPLVRLRHASSYLALSTRCLARYKPSREVICLASRLFFKYTQIFH